jgi:hypothetical protein
VRSRPDRESRDARVARAMRALPDCNFRRPELDDTRSFALRSTPRLFPRDERA